MFGTDRALRSFRTYWYGLAFVARTDRCALAYLISFSDNKAILIRWSLLLAEFEFDTEYRPGNAIQHVAALIIQTYHSLFLEVIALLSSSVKRFIILHYKKYRYWILLNVVIKVSVQQVKIKNCSFCWLFTDESMSAFPRDSIWTNSPDTHNDYGPALSGPICETVDHPIWANCLANSSSRRKYKH